MRRAVFFVFFACGSSEPAPQHVVIEPLPTVSASVAAPPAPTVQVPPASSSLAVRDLRRTMLRSAALVVTETQALENLASVTAANSPDRPTILRRLAENYVELRKLGKTEASAKAIQHYTSLVTSYPTYAQVDEAYYYLAIEYETVGDLNNARRNYYELIKRAPSSKYVPYAYYAFGEIFFDEAKSDPSKWEFAKQAYSEVVKFGASPIAHDARCRLAQTFDALGDPMQAASWRAKAGPCGS